MRFGINTFLFTFPFTNASVPLFQRFKDWGFDSVEIAIADLRHIDPIYIKNKLDEAGLVCGSLTPCYAPSMDLRGTYRQQRASLEFMSKLLKQMTLLGCPSLIGAVYSRIGRTDAVPRALYRRQWRTVAKNLKELCGRAADLGCQIALEPLNRFETDFINTCEQGLEMIHDVDSPALKLHLDTFHMNIEEKDPAAAVRKAGRHLGHLHACGSDRGTPGNDEIDWRSIAAALKSIHYQGDVVIESFTSDMKSIARAASIWRKIEPTRDEIAYKGIKFLKNVLK